MVLGGFRSFQVLVTTEYFQGRLCDKIGLLGDTLCDFFRTNLHCFTRFQRKKNTFMLFNRQFECKGIIKHLACEQALLFGQAKRVLARLV